MVTSRSPLVPSLRVDPLPRTRMTRPLGVPAGSLSRTVEPVIVGTSISVPSAASVKVTGTVTVRLSPERPNTWSGVTCTTTYRSPADPPRSPGAPLPLILMRWPSRTPAGMRTLIVRVFCPRPEPLQDGQGSSTTRPRPRHSRHGSAIPNRPALRDTWPVPSQLGHTRGTVPALAPVPRQASQAAPLVMRSGTVTPSTASRKPRVTSDSTSAPRRGPVPGARPADPPRLLKMVPNRSPTPPPPAPPAPPCPKRSDRSNGTPPGPPAPPPPAPPGNPNGLPPARPEVNRSRVSSYSARFFLSDSTS